jgi:Asx homology domain
MLSSESQAALTALLPPTAFHGFQHSPQPKYPSADTDSMMVDQPASPPSDMLDLSVFTDPHFLAAARTFQDHIYSDWMSDAHREKVNKFQAAIRDGTLAVAWKDEVWEKNNKPSQPQSTEKTASLDNVPESSARAG